MTLQEAFNKIWDWFVVQKKPQAQFVGKCSYRTPDGNKCAMGVLIPDEAYQPIMDCEPQTGIDSILNKYPDLQQYMPSDCSVSVLAALQNVHDGYISRDVDFTTYITDSLTKFASVNQLSVPYISEEA